MKQYHELVRLKMKTESVNCFHSVILGRALKQATTVTCRYGAVSVTRLLHSQTPISLLVRGTQATSGILIISRGLPGISPAEFSCGDDQSTISSIIFANMEPTATPDQDSPESTDRARHETGHQDTFLTENATTDSEIESSKTDNTHKKDGDQSDGNEPRNSNACENSQKSTETSEPPPNVEGETTSPLEYDAQQNTNSTNYNKIEDEIKKSSHSDALSEDNGDHNTAVENKSDPTNDTTNSDEYKQPLETTPYISPESEEADKISNTQSERNDNLDTKKEISENINGHYLVSYSEKDKALAKPSLSPSVPSLNECPFSGQTLNENTGQDSDQGVTNKTSRKLAENSNESHNSSNTNGNHHVNAAETSSVPNSSGKDQQTLSSSGEFSSEARTHEIPQRNIRSMFPQAHNDDDPSASNTRIRSESGDPANDNKWTSHGEGQDIILVTGGCGFLGQHIVKLLHLRAPHVGEIRVLDLTRFENKLDYQATKPVKSLVGDVSNADFVNKSLEGVHSVIHVAGLVSWGTFPDFDGMERINVQGTLNIVNACLKNNVQRLVYCSTVDVAVGSKPIRGGTEEDTPVPDRFLFPGYPESKFHGERLVQGTRDRKRHDGGELQAVILRPNVLYGELDKFYVANALKMAKDARGILYKIGNGKAMFQQAYVGNAAWAFVCADTAMRSNPHLTHEVFYIPDGTPVQNSFNFIQPYLQARGFRLSDGHLSYALSHSAVAAAELFAKGISRLMKVHLPVQSCTIAYINTDLYFKGDKAKRLLGYEPLYTPYQAREMSMKYYTNLDLEDKPFGYKAHDHNKA